MIDIFYVCTIVKHHIVGKPLSMGAIYITDVGLKINWLVTDIAPKSTKVWDQEYPELKVIHLPIKNVLPPRI